MIAGCLRLRRMATDGRANLRQNMVKRGGLKRGDNLMLCKVNWSAECLLTNYFMKLLLEIAITYVLSICCTLLNFL